MHFKWELAIAISVSVFMGSATRADAWWEYAQWGISAKQLMAASDGRLKQCERSIPICRPPYAARLPDYYIENVTTLGLSGDAGFCFDSSGHLMRTVLVFTKNIPTAKEVRDELDGAYGRPAADNGGAIDIVTWRDRKRDTSIVLIDNSPDYVAVEYMIASLQL